MPDCPTPQELLLPPTRRILDRGIPETLAATIPELDEATRLDLVARAAQVAIELESYSPDPGTTLLTAVLLGISVGRQLGTRGWAEIERPADGEVFP